MKDKMGAGFSGLGKDGEKVRNQEQPSRGN
jgi:hypothetical protein